MNWTLALPEIVLACLGMAILVFGVLRKDDGTQLATMFAVGALLVAGMLTLSRQTGFGYHGQFISDSFSTFNKTLILAGSALSLLLSLEWNRSQNIARFEFSGAGPVLHRRHDDHGVGVQPDDAVSGPGTAITGPLRPRGLRARRCTLLRGRA